MRLQTLIVATALGLPCACSSGSSIVHTELAVAGEPLSAIALSDALEDLIAAGKDSSADRAFAYKRIREHEENTAAYAFARAAVTGRLVQSKGLLAADLVGDVEYYARKSRAIDPTFRDGAATRMLGTLYVLAPAALLRHGDSEAGLELLEGLVKSRPDLLENHLRLAEAYLALGDPAPAQPYLCHCRAKRASLRRDDQALLAQLLAEAGELSCKGALDAPGPEGRAESEVRAVGVHYVGFVSF